MKDSTNECQFAEGQEDVLHMRVCDLTRHLVALIRLDKLADWTEIYMKPTTLIIHGAEEIDGLSDTYIEVMRLVRKRTAFGHKTVVVWGEGNIK